MNTNLTQNEKLLIRSIFTSPLSLRLRIAFVLGIGILPNLFDESQRLLDPLLLCISPAWSFYLIRVLFPVLHNPRKSEWHSTLCLNYNLRKRLAKKFIVYKLIEGSVIQTLGLLLFSTIFLAKIHNIIYDISLQIATISFISMFLMILFFALLFHFFDNFILKKDCSRLFKFHLPFYNVVSWHQNMIRLSAVALSFFFFRQYRPLIRRQLLYLIRSESIFLILISFSGLTFCFFNALIIAKQNILVSAITNVYYPLIVSFLFTRTISKSNFYLFNCEYYDVTSRTLYISNIQFSIFQILPYLICFLYGLFSSPIKSNYTLVAFSGILAFINVIFFISYRWSFRNWSTFTKCLLIITIFVCFIGISGSINGSFFEGIIIPLIIILIHLYLGFIKGLSHIAE